MRGLLLGAALLALPAGGLSAASPFDGKYSGQRTSVRGEPPICVAPGPVSWTVTDGQVTVKFGNVTVTAEIGADGSFRKDVQYQIQARQNATTTLQGRITGANLEADLETYACKQHYSLKKV